MTRFTDNVGVKRLDVEATAIDMQAGSSAKPTGTLRDNEAGFVVMGQQVTVLESMSAATSVAKIPAGAPLLDVLYHEIVNMGSAAVTVDILIGTSGDDDHYGRFANVSSQGALSLVQQGTNVCGINMHASRATAGPTPVFVKATAVSGNLDSTNPGVGLLTFLYSRS